MGLGALFALGMIGISAILTKRANGKFDSNEEFAVAKRSVSTGLTAAGVISSWTWSTTLLSSCTVSSYRPLRSPFGAGSFAEQLLIRDRSQQVAYQYGVAGALFYGCCNSTQYVGSLQSTGRYANPRT